MKHWTRMVPPTMLTILAACASNGATTTAPASPNELSGEQVAHFPNALQAVQTMRSQWLRGRAPGDLSNAGGNVRVFRDGIEVGGVDELQSMPTEGIAYIRYYNGIEASQRWGLGHASGVIYVASKAGLSAGGGGGGGGGGGSRQ